MIPRSQWTAFEKMEFGGVFLASQAVGVLMIALCIVWFVDYRGGVAWTENPGLEFNWHPILMTVGLIFLYGEAMVIYRVLYFLPKKVVKIIHAVIQMVVIIMVSVSLKAVFDSHNLKETPIPNLYSLHSWLGLSAVILFSSQLVAGFGIFFWPGGSETLRRGYMEHHTFWGVAIFTLAVATALTGIVEKSLFSILKDYAKLPPEAYILNFFGYSIVVFAAMIGYIVSKANWKRPPDQAQHYIALPESQPHQEPRVNPGHDTLMAED